ncbi:TPA: YlbF family regulator [Staphylococcus aureus]|nr:YlbF family regulator [Staphylococcus aureus]
MINEASLAILDDIDELADMIVASDIYASFEQAKQALENNDEAHLLYQSFLKSKEKYDEVMRFGKYHPDYKKVMLETRQRKRAYEMLDLVMHYKAREMALQHLIDEVVTKIAYAVSEYVKIETGNPFFQTSHSGCATGGSCNCSL